jgi:hypothetical protein
MVTLMLGALLAFPLSQHIGPGRRDGVPSGPGGQRGEGMAIQDVVDRLGVSISTASRGGIITVVHPLSGYGYRSG